MPNINKSLRPSDKSSCIAQNSVYTPTEKTAFIIYGRQNSGKSSTVCYIAEQLRNYYGTRHTVAVFNDSLQKDILHTMIVEKDVNKCIGLSSQGDDLPAVLNNTLSLCLTYSRFLVIAVRDVYSTDPTKSWRIAVEDICKSFGYTTVPIPFTHSPTPPASSIRMTQATNIITSIQKVIP